MASEFRPHSGTATTPPRSPLAAEAPLALGSLLGPAQPGTSGLTLVAG